MHDVTSLQTKTMANDNALFLPCFYCLVWRLALIGTSGSINSASIVLEVFGSDVMSEYLPLRCNFQIKIMIMRMVIMKLLYTCTALKSKFTFLIL